MFEVSAEPSFLFFALSLCEPASDRPTEAARALPGEGERAVVLACVERTAVRMITWDSGD